MADVFWHEHGKTNAEEWAESVDTGTLQEGFKKVNQGKRSGPWEVLCDNESFLRAVISAAAHRRWRVGLIKLPAKSPDFNSVEMFWAWLRKRLRALDLDDFVKKRPVPGKEAYKMDMVLSGCVRSPIMMLACIKSSSLDRLCKRSAPSLREVPDKNKIEQDIMKVSGRGSIA